MKTEGGGPMSACNYGLGAGTSRPKFVIYDRSETVWQSIATDSVTFVGLLLCIWFSQVMGSSLWEFVSAGMFFWFVAIKLPWEKVTRTTKLCGKAEAKAWAESLPDDGA